MKNPNQFDSYNILSKLNLNNLMEVTFLIIYAIVVTFFLLNGDVLYDFWRENNYSYLTLIYIACVALFLGIRERLPKELEDKFPDISSGFLMSFIFSTIVFIILRDANILSTGIDTAVTASNIIPLFIFHMVVVTTSEEIIFRGILFRYFYQFHWIVAVLVTSILFAIFHVSAYQANPSPLIFAFGMGIIISLSVKRFNIGWAIGIHLAWNCIILGITVL